MEFKLGEFFCGPGGIALGALNTPEVINEEGDKFFITPSWASDFDLDTCKTYGLNIHGNESSNQVLHEDVKRIDIPKLEGCDGFAFGFPCNDFSIVGESKGLDGQYGPLYSYGINYLKIHKPMWFVAENVGGLSSSNSGKAFELILNSMIKAGYVITPHLYKFEHYGVPQSRHRILIVGIRNDLKIKYRIPKQTHIDTPITAREALTVPVIASNADNHIFTAQSKNVIERLKWIKPGDNAWSDDIPEDLRLNVKGAKLSNIYKRLDPDKPSYTVTGSGGGGTHMYHWSENRALTNRERARLQTFPDDYIFIGKKESVRKQIGMAVPPIGMSIVFQAILKSFANIKYESIEANIKI
jgi:DNA (cytosine-5)-methyltransferase 1